MSILALQSDLFDKPDLAGLSQTDEIVTPDEERALVGAIDAAELSPFRFHGWLGKRLTASYGWRYDFDTADFSPTDATSRLAAAGSRQGGSVCRPGTGDLVQALVIRYDPGAGIGWHRDRPVFEHVLGISLGAPAVMRFRRRRPGGFDRVSRLLPPRSIYHLTGEARHEWEHSIAGMAMTRWSITFRSLSEKGIRLAD